MLTARALRCRYGAFEAVRGIDLTVHEGELFALLGTNGAGKTTTLETFEGHRAADDGTVEVLGLDPRAHHRELAARTGVVFQQSGLPAELTPREVLRLWSRLTPDARRHLDVDEALARVGLGHRVAVRIRQLSGGERRRLDLAVALLNDPELVFLDEPTTGMDPEARMRTWGIIRELLADGVTVVLTTHYLEEAEALADRLAIMHEGRLATGGTLAEVVAAQPGTIQAELPPDAPQLPPFPERRHDGSSARLELRTTQLQRDLTRLLRWAEDHDVELSGLQAADASLAQVFHELSAGEVLAEGDLTDPEARP